MDFLCRNFGEQPRVLKNDPSVTYNVYKQVERLELYALQVVYSNAILAIENDKEGKEWNMRQCSEIKVS